MYRKALMVLCCAALAACNQGQGPLSAQMSNDATACAPRPTDDELGRVMTRFGQVFVDGVSSGCNERVVYFHETRNTSQIGSIALVHMDNGQWYIYRPAGFANALLAVVPTKANVAAH